MTNQLNMFETILPPCKHCGGSPQWEQYKSTGLTSFQDLLFKLVCSHCNFETDGMVSSSKSITVSHWVTGVPRHLYDPYLKRSLNLKEYYSQCFGDITRPTLKKK